MSMASTHFISLNFSLRPCSSSLLNPSDACFSFPKCPPKWAKFSTQPLVCCSSTDWPPEGYRKNVGICLINSSKKIFAASRLHVIEAWQMPQGGIDEGEDPKVAAIRELREETGICTAQVVAEVPYWVTYDFSPEVREKIKHMGYFLKGQVQKWYLFKFTGKEEEINLQGDGTEKPEFGQWSWMTPEQIIEHAVDFKKGVYKEVLSVFAPYLQ
ncbi:nudix hydrolase 26, chloroplastic-like [Mangifera indica]|uniref:nudix hydrolase 26, chloroplastic-like n=1 Tax=Mangifera indica TaxID=29780 RepID=UPI001CFA04F5|nr:nudix hydrolase 26, chloroplastic-like [Mangifera indica]